MILKRLQVKTGQENLLTNSYIICDDETKETMVIDPGGEEDKIVELLDILHSKLKYILLTHCHADHIGGVKNLKDARGGKVLISREDSKWIADSNVNMDKFINMNIPNFDIDSRLDDGDIIHIGNIEFKVISTPGHTRGSISLYCENERLVFTGDTLFSGSWGRTDLPTGNFKEIICSISDKLLCLPDETIIYPGHGKVTMINDERMIYYDLKEKEF